MYSKSSLSGWDSWDSLVYFSEAAASNYEAGPETTSPENMQSFTVSVIHKMKLEFFFFQMFLFFFFKCFCIFNLKMDVASKLIHF